MCTKGFTMQDLSNMLSIIDACTQRGAFHAQELSGVGQLYDKLLKCKQEGQKETAEKSVNTALTEVPGEGNEVSEVSEVSTNCDGGKCELPVLETCDDCPNKKCDDCPCPENN